MDPTLFQNLLSQFRDQIFSVLANDGGLFQQLGQSIFSAVTIIMIVFAGARIMFSEHHAFHKLRLLTGLILAVFIMLRLYTTPSSLLGGYSFSELIPRFAFSLADKVGIETQQAMIARLHQITAGLTLKSFNFLQIRDAMNYFLITFLVALLELAMFVVVAFGYLALGATVTVGPILIPFVLVPKLDFLFWGWLKATIKYSFYPVIGNLVLLGICKLMLATLNATALVAAPTTGAFALEILQDPIVIVLFLAGIYSIFKIPSLVTDIFTGAAGAGQGVQQAVTQMVMAAV
jgi:hypothetical protein